jgi:hypothetical protein
MGIHLMRSVPNAAVMFVTFEVVSKWLQKTQMRQSVQHTEDITLENKDASGRKLAFLTPIRPSSLKSFSRF